MSKKQYSAAWYADNHQRYMNTAKGRAKTLWLAARQRAEQKGVVFSLPFAWVHERVQTGRCEVTGLPFNLEERRTKTSTGGPYTPSIDRRDPVKGYTPENCRVILWALNCALGQWGDEVFTVIAKAYAESEWLR